MTNHAVRILDSLKEEVSDSIFREILHAADVDPSRADIGQIPQLMEAFDQMLDEATRAKIMEKCAAHCIFDGFIQKVRDVWNQSHNIDFVLESLNRDRIGGGYLRRNGNKILATYEQCYCHAMKHVDQKMSSTFCNCSRGWFVELFGKGLDRPVSVRMLSSILQGASQCEFEITCQENDTP